MNEKLMRENLISFLTEPMAHVTFEDALSGLQPENRNKRPAENIKSIWEELEHMRISQEDIFRYAFDDKWVSPAWPVDHWPKENAEFNDSKWDKTIKLFNKDLDEVIKFVKDENTDLSIQFPHGEGRTYFRQIVMIIDHNSYHISKIVLVRKLLGDWNL